MSELQIPHDTFLPHQGIANGEQVCCGLACPSSIATHLHTCPLPYATPCTLPGRLPACSRWWR